MDEATFRKVLKESLAEQTASFDDKLDKRLSEQTASFDDKLDKRLSEQTASFDDKLNSGLAKQFGHFERRLDILEQKLDSKADGERVYKALDGIAKRLGIDEQERAGMSAQLSRHDNWIGQLADATHTQLVPER